MELIIGLIVIAVVAYFLFFRKKTEVVEAAPYKVETPSFPVAKEEKPAPAKKAKTAVKKATTRKPKAK